MPRMIMEMGPMALPTMSSESSMTAGSWMCSRNRAAPARMAIMLMLVSTFFNAKLFSPQSMLLAWLHSKNSCTDRKALE